MEKVWAGVLFIRDVMTIFWQPHLSLLKDARVKKQTRTTYWGQGVGAAPCDSVCVAPPYGTRLGTALPVTTPLDTPIGSRSTELFNGLYGTRFCTVQQFLSQIRDGNISGKGGGANAATVDFNTIAKRSIESKLLNQT